MQVGKASLVCVRDGQQVLEVADLGVDLISPRFRSAFRGAVHFPQLDYRCQSLSLTTDWNQAQVRGQAGNITAPI